MILRKETETILYSHNQQILLFYIRMNDTPQGDGNFLQCTKRTLLKVKYIRMNDTPQGDGNLRTTQEPLTSFIQPIRMNDTPQGDGNML